MSLRQQYVFPSEDNVSVREELYSLLQNVFNYIETDQSGQIEHIIPLRFSETKEITTI